MACKNRRVGNKYMFMFWFFPASLSIATAGAWLAWPSAVIPMIEKDGIPMKMTEGEISTMVALMDLGNILSPVPASYLMDKIGRRPTLMSAGVCAIIASAAVMLANGVCLIYAARIFAGFTKGIAYAVLPIYAAEVANTKVRGGLTAVSMVFLTLGTTVDYAIGPHFSYQALNITNAIIPILLLSTIMFFPESVHFLAMKGKHDQALNALAKYRQVKKENAKENGLEAEYQEVSRKVEEDMRYKGRFLDLISTPANKRALMIISLLAFFQRSTGISPIIAYSTSTMPKEGGGLSISEYMIVFSVVHAITAYGVMPLVDRLGRRPLMLFSSLTTGLVTGFIGVYYWMERSGYDVRDIQWIPYAGLVLFAITYGAGAGIIPSTIVGELFPTNIKSYASSVSAIILAAVSFTLNKIFHVVAKSYGAHVMFWSFTAASFLCTLFTYVFLFETKGKTFTEIRDYMAKLSEK